MKIIYDKNELKEEAIVATVGFFDGVHSGHRFLIQEMCDLAKNRRLPSALITFPVHPRVVLHSDYQPKLLNSFDERLELLSMTGVDYIIVIDFTPDLATMAAHEFIATTLASEWHVKILLVGFDHRFGYQREEGFEQYAVYGKTCDMEVVKVPSYINDIGKSVSSSVVRRLIEAGDMAAVYQLQGYRYRLKGHVVSGHQIGRKLGFPTANITVDDPYKAIPRNGSYAVLITINGRQYKGMLYIGSRPTIDYDDSLRIEVNIFDFSMDIYDEPITVEFVAFIREDRKFDSLADLRTQMAEDVKMAKSVLIKELTDLSELFYDAIDILKGMISIPSISREEKAVADFLQSHWKKAGHTVNRQGNNIWLSTAIDAAKPTVLLNSHVDTVRPVASWTRDAFAPDSPEDDILYGLGSNDAGASVVSLYEAFCLLSQKEQTYNLIYLVSAEEEVSGKNGIESVLPVLPEIAFAVVGEPTGMQPAVAEKGLMVLDCTVTGKAGHAARDEGVNAITLAIADMEWFNSFHFSEKSGLLGPVKMSVTQLQAGTQHNVIPDRCTFVVDIRSNGFYSNEALLQQIKGHVQCEVVPRSTRLQSSQTSLSHPFVQRAVMLGKQPFGSPTMSDQALMPFTSVKIGPGDPARSHSADEYIRPSEIREAIDTYVTLLDGLKI